MPRPWVYMTNEPSTLTFIAHINIAVITQRKKERERERERKNTERWRERERERENSKVFLGSGKVWQIWFVGRRRFNFQLILFIISYHLLLDNDDILVVLVEQMNHFLVEKQDCIKLFWWSSSCSLWACNETAHKETHTRIWSSWCSHKEFC